MQSLYVTPDCTACSKPVYYNDLQVRSKSEHIYHKYCFKCEQCACQLTLKTFAYHGDKLLCHTHYMAHFQMMNSYGGEGKFKKQKDDIVTIKHVEKEIEPEPVTWPEPMKCTPIDDRPLKICHIHQSYANNPFIIYDQRLRRGESSTDSESSYGSYEKRKPIAFKVKSSPSCESCNEPVHLYDAKMQLEGKVFHHGCFKCSHCSTQLTLKEFTYAGETLLCKWHYTQQFMFANTYAGADHLSIVIIIKWDFKCFSLNTKLVRDMAHGRPIEGLECLATMDDITMDNYVEYQTFPSMTWHPSKFCAEVTQQLLDSQFPAYMKGVQGPSFSPFLYLNDDLEPDCKAELRRLLAKGPPIYLEDKYGYPLPDNGDTHLVNVWFAHSNEERSAQLTGALVDEERETLWTNLKQLLVAMEEDEE
ncbi:hypothetical protein THRCLA_05869 [Thraustotheca clavata]|uniref:LIM zinc-binding domain-containing protein n=1 Tax=Thraustotheca clavata TaxID=74557 RepID=A0A1V9ZRX4_9STRA|nr:hypothetical protein THRCLA_05869 [Thraustotheca clavata]